MIALTCSQFTNRLLLREIFELFQVVIIWVQMYMNCEEADLSAVQMEVTKMTSNFKFTLRIPVKIAYFPLDSDFWREVEASLSRTLFFSPTHRCLSFLLLSLHSALSILPRTH